MIPATKRKKAFHPEAETAAKKPAWLKVKLPSHQNFFQVRDILKKHQLHTICQSAKCPNIAECWEQKTATFLILGDICTRRCAFCAVKKGIPAPPSLQEPFQVAEAVAAFGLCYAVITSVTRDDLADGGASLFAETIRTLKMRSPETKVEVLIPDFKGEKEGVDTIVQAQPDVVNHNLETPEALYSEINRPLENYQRSLNVLRRAKEKGAVTKSGLMVGLGEKEEEILQTLSDLRQVSCNLLTIGQYLQPTSASVPVRRYYTPQEFEQLKIISLDFGFKDVVAGPLVRSSFHASQLYQSLQNMV